MYIGNQKIVSEEKLDGQMVKVVVEADKLDELEENETLEIHEDDFAVLATEEPSDDKTALRNDRCRKTIEEIVLVLMKHNTQVHDLNHIYQSTTNTIQMAQEQLEKEFYKNHETKRTVNQFKKHILIS